MSFIKRKEKDFKENQKKQISKYTLEACFV